MTLKKNLFTAEMIVCFAPALVLFLLCMLLFPLQLMALFDPDFLHWDGPLIFVLIMSGSAAGISALTVLLRKLSDNDRSLSRPYLVLIAALIGLVSCAMAIKLTSFQLWSVIFLGILPFLGTIHLLFVSRRMFTPSDKADVRPRIPAFLWMAALVLGAGFLFIVETRGNLSYEDLVARQATWIRNRPHSYAFELNITGDHVQPQRRITVQKDEVTSAHYVDVHAQRNPDRYPPATEGSWTIDIVFSKLIDAQSRGKRVRARFDEQWGHIEQSTVESRDTSAGWDLTVRNFVPSQVNDEYIRRPTT